MKVRLFALFLLIFAVLPAGTSSAQDQDKQDTVDNSYVSCHMADSIHSTLYLSNIFLGDSARNLEYSRAFEFMIRERYPRATGRVSCSLDGNRLEAQRRENKFLSLFANLYRSIVPTGWSG